MDFELSEDQRLLVDSAQKMTETEIVPVLAANDPGRPLDKKEMLRIFAVFAREGLTAPRLPAESGGSDMKMLDYGLVFEQLPPAIAISLMSHEVTTTRIHAESTAEQRRRFLPACRPEDLLHGLDGTGHGLRSAWHQDARGR
jgi:alkylation response protein AidB-like acyl-CoA dehydrogenase